MSFTTFVIPKIVERIKNTKEVSSQPDAAKEVSVQPDAAKEVSVQPPADVIEETEEFFDPPDTLSNNDESSVILVKGFKRMENAVVELRKDLIRKVDESILNADDKDQSKLNDIATKLDTLENLLHENNSELKSVNEKLAEIAGKQSTVKLEQADIEKLASAVSGSKKVELDEIASAIKDVKDKIDDNKLMDVVESNKKVLEKLEGVKDISDRFSVGLNKLEQVFKMDVFSSVATNSEQSVSALNSLNGHMVDLLSKFDGIPKPTVASTSNIPVNETNVEATNADPVGVVPRKVKKCKFFSTSVALGCDIKKLEYKLDCEIEMVETYHIVENPTAKDPEKFLKNMLKVHINEGEVDFIVISVGSNNITFL